MKIFYSDKPLELNPSNHSVFLAGPTPRSINVPSWRPHAIDALNHMGYGGQVIVPERYVKSNHIDYDEQAEWEHLGLENCSSIVFWIPRDLDTMPAFTTNIEFGRYCKDSRVFYGRPDNAPKNRYLDWLYKKYQPHKKIYNNLGEVLQASICL